MKTNTKNDAKVTPYAGLKASCRHITSRDSSSDKIQFAVGTAIVGKSNQIQIIEYDDIQESIRCIQTLDHDDEVWWIECHPTELNLLFTISANSKSNSKATTLFKVPPQDSLATALGSTEHQQLEILSVFKTDDPVSTRVKFLPPDSKKCLISCKTSLNIFDVENPDKSIHTINEEEGLLSASAIDPIHPDVVAGCVGGNIKLWDFRSGEVTYHIEDAHDTTALDIAFNESKPFWMCTGGNDGFLRCWDVRANKPKCEFRASSHWVTRTVPSVSHDQLILTSGTDSKVRVFNSSQFAFQNEGHLPDGEIIKSIRHDDSVYCVSWSLNNPWVFASVSYKGQVNVCQLPSQVVDSILMGDDLVSD